MSPLVEAGLPAMDINFLAVLVAAVAAFVASAGWYGVLGDAMVRHSARGAAPNPRRARSLPRCWYSSLSPPP